ncbi:MAG: peptide-methionine (R)-S-oxide reductase MsrB [Flavobacteriaceae bacterium]|nr:peptide-methionine (R)-S-oxide reductase MsrB [Flavobacteriaceae bacterium]
MRKIIIILLLLVNCTIAAQEKPKMDKKVNKTEAEWKEILTPQQYHVLREKGTDRAGDYGYTKHFEKGTYHCAACNAQLFDSNTKYESNCGWPSFDDAIKGAVDFTLDTTHGMVRTEITCTNCGGHLGHIFDDGPQETTGKRYCVNTSSIRFEKSKK